LILEHAEHGSIYNIGSGKSVSIKQLADCVSGRQIISPNRIGAVSRTCADITKLRHLGFESQVDVLEWLTDQVKKLTLKTLHKKETA
jgi:UDP-glucose 4-epimerase